MRNLLLTMFLPMVTACSQTGVRPVTPDDPELRLLVQYKNGASARCSGASYQFALGTEISLNAKAEAELSETLLSKGYGTGKGEIGLTLSEKRELSNVLGTLTQEQVDKFLGRYQPCMDKEMEDYFLVRGLSYPVISEAKVIWDDRIHHVSRTTVAHQTEKSGNWRYYEACVEVPSDAFIIQDSVTTNVVSGVAPGSWGNWKPEVKYSNDNEFGPTLVCRGFDHQIHDQDRVLEIGVNYKLPKKIS